MMTKVRLFAAVMLTAIFLLPLAGCGADSDYPDTTSSSTTGSE